MKFFEMEMRVPFFDTDKMQVVHHANYIRYFETARTEYFRARGLAYSDMEKYELQIPVLGVDAKFQTPTVYDEVIILACSMTKLGPASMEFDYEIRNAETGLVQGAEIKAACSDPENVSCFADTFLTPNVVKTFEVEFKTKNEDCLTMEFHHCPLLKAWQDLHFDDATCEKLCDIAMDGDRNIAKAMGFDFHLGKTIAQGHPTCEIMFSKQKK